MKHGYYRLHARMHAWRYVGSESFLSLLLVVLVLVMPVSAAAKRLQDRSLYMNSTVPGATTTYKVSFRYMSPEPIGSVDMLFCIDPIPYHPCVAPPGLDVSNAVLSDQSGETGYSIGSQSANHIVLTRTSQLLSNHSSSYTFDNVVNPTDTDQAFAIRLRTHSTLDATGPEIDFGSVRGQVTQGIEIQSQVPPILVFCVAEEVTEKCMGTNEVYYKDMGLLKPEATLTAQSQMSVGTNASGGFAITAVGAPLSAGTNVIDSLSTPAESEPGSNQFGINLVANDAPDVGEDPVGTWANAVVAPDYGVPNQYKYVSGDVIAYSPSVSLMKKFTVSYIVNSHEDLAPGVYSTTITYIATGRF